MSVYKKFKFSLEAGHGKVQDVLSHIVDSAGAPTLFCWTKATKL